VEIEIGQSLLKKAGQDRAGKVFMARKDCEEFHLDKRIIMEHETESIEIKKKDNTAFTISGLEFPHTWAMEQTPTQTNILCQSN
jgi:hypothetical protein